MVINFCDWSQEKAVEHPAVFAIVEQEVKPIRLKVTHSNSLAPSWLPTDQVFSDAVVVIAASSPAQFALLSSGPHVAWAWQWGSSLKGSLITVSTRPRKATASPSLPMCKPIFWTVSWS
ncbi:hypothetical protein OOK29_00490 [Streptomyces phaeochromogenes]|uniref:Uncharacterized protein n=1 Tax=Streptomyces phaeochromogenes TaxID=1923 RepID=A0ABZ1HK43_STRPH|nr:hypothetical protein [Streptomyces phaeochromogenes]MCX5596613.1 hypothetical protein [Streptomyces phaeochromogenes]WSD17620.1 hypothetical protein OHB35_32780 [Streptomyces phaeochromogenes]WSJ05576.1 hypothetical protein OG437_18860 [Streptomyces phaeochromogenes]